MGTRSLVHIKDEGLDSQTLVTIYRQFDGYPEGMGKDLVDFLSNIKLCNGIGIEERKQRFANGPGCLAAQLISRLKQGIGNVYIYPPDSSDCGEVYEYTIYFDPIYNKKNKDFLEGFESYIKCKDIYGKKILYDGLAKDCNIDKDGKMSVKKRKKKKETES